MRVKGNVKVDWYKGDELLDDAGHVVIVDEEDGETFTLALEEASVQDSGIYKCVATNKAGTVTCTATLKVTSGKPSGKELRPEEPSEIIKPQHQEEVNSRPTFDDGKAISLTIDGDSMEVTLPDDQTTMLEQQPRTAEQPTRADQKPTRSEQKPTSPKEKRAPPQKAPKVTPEKSPEDKTSKRPKTVKPDKSQHEPGQEISFTIDTESGLMTAPEILPEQEIAKPKSKKPQVAEKTKPRKEESKPVAKEMSFTVDGNSVLMASPDNIPNTYSGETKRKGTTSC